MSDMGYYVLASSLTRRMPPKYLAAPSLSSFLYRHEDRNGRKLAS